MADPAFDRGRFAARLQARALGRDLRTLAEAASTNDEAWAAAAAGAPHGAAIVADAQTRGRGRAGRSWHATPGKSLALSVLLRAPAGRGLAALPLAAGLAVAQALERLGVDPALKWPNDVLLEGRKVSGVLCESRRAGREADGGAGPPAAVVGVGVNVAQERGELPPDLAATATSLALAGIAADRESVAAEFLNALEPLWLALAAGDPSPVLAGWTARARFWGRPVVVRTPAGEVRGTARALDAAGALVLTAADGTALTVLAGDLVTPPGEAR